MIERAEIERFVKTLFGQAADYDGPAFTCSLLNDNMGGERKLLTRSLDDLAAHAARWDGRDRGLYICANLLRPGERSRNKGAVGRIVTIHADTDFKTIGIDRDEALARIAALPHAPTMVVESGGGLHLYWVLSDPLDATPDNIALVEDLNALAADVVGGDTQARDVSRLLRLPGTHNTKGDGWREVKVAVCEPGRVHDIADLEEWLTVQSPVIQRLAKAEKASTAPRQDENPYLAAARLLGYKPPLDIEDALSAMAYQGGENSIHETQVRVSASLLSRGTPVDEVVAILLEATKAAAGEFGKRWKWEREEFVITRMCTDWLKKHPELREVKAAALTATADVVVTASADEEEEPNPFSAYGASLGQDDDEEPVREPVRANGTAGAKGSRPIRQGQVVNLDEQRRKREAAKPRKTREADTSHALVAKAVLKVLRDKGEDILFVGSDLWRYQDGLWSSDPDRYEAWLKVEIERACRGLEIASTNKLINEARGFIQRDPDHYHPSITWDDHGLVPARNGLLDPGAGTLRPYRPEDFATWRMEADYLPGAQCPWWLRLLDDTFALFDESDRVELIQAIQEFIGCQIVVGERRRTLRAALGLTGKPNSGKSQITEVCREIMGRDRCASLMFGNLADRFYLEPLTRKRALIVDEAVSDKTAIPSSIFKALVTGEPLPVDRKNATMASLAFTGPIVFTANEWPYAADTTSGFADRLLIIHCPGEFKAGDPPIGAAAEAFARGFSKPYELIAAEDLPGIINWALEGWRVAKARGSILLPRRSRELRQHIADASAPILPFIRDCILETDKADFVETPAVYAVFHDWFLAEHGENSHPYGFKRFWSMMRMNLPGLDTPSQKKARYAGNGVGLGIHLSPIGVELWQAIKLEKQAGSKVPTWVKCQHPNHHRRDRFNTKGDGDFDGEMAENPENSNGSRKPLF